MMPSARARSPMVTYSFWSVAACLVVAGSCFLRTSFVATLQPVGGIMSSTSRSEARPETAGRICSVERLAAEAAVDPFFRVRLADGEHRGITAGCGEEGVARGDRTRCRAGRRQGEGGGKPERASSARAPRRGGRASSTEPRGDRIWAAVRTRTSSRTNEGGA